MTAPVLPPQRSPGGGVAADAFATASPAAAKHAGSPGHLSQGSGAGDETHAAMSETQEDGPQAEAVQAIVQEALCAKREALLSADAAGKRVRNTEHALEAVQSELRDARTSEAGLQQQLDAVQHALGEARRTATTARSGLAEARAEIASYQSKADSMEHQLTSAQEQLAAAQRSAAQLRKDNSALQSALASVQAAAVARERESSQHAAAALTAESRAGQVTQSTIQLTQTVQSQASELQALQARLAQFEHNPEHSRSQQQQGSVASAALSSSLRRFQSPPPHSLGAVWPPSTPSTRASTPEMQRPSSSLISQQGGSSNRLAGHLQPHLPQHEAADPWGTAGTALQQEHTDEGTSQQQLRAKSPAGQRQAAAPPVRLDASLTLPPPPGMHTGGAFSEALSRAYDDPHDSASAAVQRIFATMQRMSGRQQQQEHAAGAQHYVVLASAAAPQTTAAVLVTRPGTDAFSAALSKVEAADRVEQHPKLQSGTHSKPVQGGVPVGSPLQNNPTRPQQSAHAQRSSATRSTALWGASAGPQPAGTPDPPVAAPPSGRKHPPLDLPVARKLNLSLGSSAAVSNAGPSSSEAAGAGAAVAAAPVPQNEREWLRCMQNSLAEMAGRYSAALIQVSEKKLTGSDGGSRGRGGGRRRRPTPKAGAARHMTPAAAPKKRRVSVPAPAQAPIHVKVPCAKPTQCSRRAVSAQRQSVRGGVPHRERAPVQAQWAQDLVSILQEATEPRPTQRHMQPSRDPVCVMPVAAAAEQVVPAISDGGSAPWGSGRRELEVAPWDASGMSGTSDM